MRVLIVEDDVPLGLFLQKGLKLEGYDVDLVRDGEAALLHASVERPDLMVLDLMLPKRDGFEVLAVMLRLYTVMRVIVLTGRMQVQERVRCLNHGVDDILSKPFSLQELAARCGALLQLRERAAGPLLMSRVSGQSKENVATMPIQNLLERAQRLSQAFFSPIVMPDQDLQADRLSFFERLIEERLAMDGFYLLSSFAARHGMWEVRFARNRARMTQFISLACEMQEEQETVFEVWVGVSSRDEDNYLAERKLIDRPRVLSLAAASPAMDQALGSAREALKNMENVLGTQLPTLPPNRLLPQPKLSSTLATGARLSE